MTLFGAGQAIVLITEFPGKYGARYGPSLELFDGDGTLFQLVRQPLHCVLNLDFRAVFV
jgi:hypothetical protein